MFGDISLTQFIFGRLTWEAIPYHEPILVVTFAVVALGGIALLGLITKFKLWGYLWNEWFTSVDHKRIGIMYIVLALIMLLRGFVDAHHDARPAGDGAEQRRLPAARAFRPDLQLARRDHDLLHGDAVHDRA
jgi:hypothetical protein